MTETKKAVSEIVVYKPGEVIFQENEPSDFMLIISSGRAQVYLGDGIDKIPLALVSDGQFLGELSCLLGGGRTATAVAVTKVVAAKIRKQFIEESLDGNPVWMGGLYKCLAERIRDMNEIIRRNKIVDQLLEMQTAAAEVPTAPKKASGS